MFFFCYGVWVVVAVTLSLFLTSHAWSCLVPLACWGGTASCAQEVSREPYCKIYGSITAVATETQFEVPGSNRELARTSQLAVLTGLPYLHAFGENVTRVEPRSTFVGFSGA